ncbi:MAG: tautomerase family protein [Bifidobacteriaceae bacterium]|jgi:phenylpyruvate tautomerase PptA (4-oxalocrotonate tautomerase family)|nr:tautomerase family protein [Bifidobacteriaceae bacterium]
MPLVQVDLDRELWNRHGQKLSEAIQRAQVKGLEIPPEDLFHVFRPRDPGEIIFDPGFMGVDRRSLLVIRVVFVHEHPVVKHKYAFYQAVVEELGALGVRSEDIMVCVTENTYEDWYAGGVN